MSTAILSSQYRRVAAGDAYYLATGRALVYQYGGWQLECGHPLDRRSVGQQGEHGHLSLRTEANSLLERVLCPPLGESCAEAISTSRVPQLGG